MNICLVQSVFGGHSGSGRILLELAHRFAEDRHQVTIVCHEADTSLDNNPNIEVIRVPRPSAKFGLWRLGYLFHLWHLSRRLPAALAGRTFDLLLGSDLLFLKPIKSLYGSALPFIYMPMSVIAPLEISTYALDPFRKWTGVRIYAWLQRWALANCDRVFRFTESAVRMLERFYDVDLSKKKLVAIYVSREFDRGAADPQPIAFERPQPSELLWVGRLIPIKNIEFLLGAVALVQSSNWVLNICSDGPDRQRLEAVARAPGLNDRVRFLGAVNDLGAVYRRASLFLTASLIEQYSLTLMEAYAFGVPILAIKPDWKDIMNAHEEQVVDGVTGYLITSEADMARRIDELLNNEPLRQQFARNAYAMKQTGYTFEAFFKVVSDAAREQLLRA